MDTFELRFYIRGEAYCQVRYYRQEMDLRVIRSQIERIGKAIVVRLRDQEMLNQISELPKLGEATPWYGRVGGGYQYRLYPQDKGCRLVVENLASGNSLLCPQELPRIEVQLEDAPLLRDVTDAPLKIIPRHAGFAFQEDEDRQEIILSVTADIFTRFAGWDRYGMALSEYEFTFIPTQVSNLVKVRHVESEEIIDLTEGIDW
jgi:hypothetical protein